MVMPAIHLSRYQVSDLFAEIKQEAFDPEDIDLLVKVARKELKNKFREADMGITGANFLLADTGTIGIVTNEGNARLVSTLPKTHVVLAGIDKILPGLKEALAILKILPRNATGQEISSYVTWISGRAPCLKDSEMKKDLHIIILDNKRMKLAGDAVLADALKCIRCGACANACPVYRMVGGHTMGHIYIGAIGLIFTHFFHGPEMAQKLIENCIGCGACRDICACGIDLPRIIKTINGRIKTHKGKSFSDIILLGILKNRKLFRGLLKLVGIFQKPISNKQGFLRHLPLVFMQGQNFRALPKIAKRSFRETWKHKKAEVVNPRLRIALFAGCLQDFVYPEQLISFINLLKNENIAVDFPPDQTCCGLPLALTGNSRAEKTIALLNLEAIDIKKYDYIVTLCDSCASQIKKNNEKIFEHGTESEKIRAGNFADKIVTSGIFLAKYVYKKKDDQEKKNIIGTFHSPCHLSGLGEAAGADRELLKNKVSRYIPAAEETTCCGFGGTYSVKFPRISAQILDKKLEDFIKTGADTIITECPGCILQLRGGVEKKKLSLKVKHLAEVLDDSAEKIK